MNSAGKVRKTSVVSAILCLLIYALGGNASARAGTWSDTGSWTVVGRPAHNAALLSSSPARPEETTVSSLTFGGLTLEERVKCQRAIEEVYWRHRIWPTQNPKPKPALEDVRSGVAIRATVEDYLRKSEALAVYWRQPITGAQLQAEMERMARRTKQPAVLKELWAALGNDPYVIAECLARPLLANRLIRNWYAQDTRYHGALRARAEAERSAYSAASQMRQMNGEYRELQWLKGESTDESTPRDILTPTLGPPGATNPAAKGEGRQLESGTTDRVTLTREEWVATVRELAQLFPMPHAREVARLFESRQELKLGDPELSVVAAKASGPQSPKRLVTPHWPEVRAQLDRLPLRELSPLKEDPDRFYVTTVLEKGTDHIKLATVEWKKEPFDAWWKRQQRVTVAAPLSVAWSGAQLGSLLAPPNPSGVYNYRLPAMSSQLATCVDDTWTPMQAPLSPRARHTAVWTGSEMIVWGGDAGFNPFNTGGRYDPATDTWTPTSTMNAPTGRHIHAAVWTGTEMIIWGGDPFFFPPHPGTGGRYNPATDSWTATSTVDAPIERANHAAVWTGSEMIVWGGSSGTDVNTGGRYNPATDSWIATSTVNAPSARSNHAAVWTSTEMIVWGGDLNNNTGGRYDPATDTWTTTSTANAPSARWFPTAVWTGREMIVWGGWRFAELNTGGRYDPMADSWTATSTANAPSGRINHTAIWTGSKMIVWGGGLTDGFSVFNTGGRYDPVTDSWTATDTTNAPDARRLHTAIWTDTEMIVWGGIGSSSARLNSGARYDPATDSWTATSTLNVPSARTGHTAVWTGGEMIVWGGSLLDPPGGRYDPATDSWTATSTVNAPSGRFGHTAIWTGAEMIVWGGFRISVFLNTGGRYDPVTDSWTATDTSSSSTPGARANHTAIWTGTEMIVWGGSSSDFTVFTNSGGRYDPVTDSWTATDTTNAPDARQSHTAIWTDTEMIIWGGNARVNPFNTGGRYDPTTDTWAPTSASNVPSARTGHTAVWTGREMIVWGGGFLDTPTTGGRYDPATDSWTATSTANAPSGRFQQTAVWTGGEMIVWGGRDRNGSTVFNTGGRYNPTADSWTATDTTNAPSPRSGHTAVWTRSEMIVWGGSNPFSGFDTGGRYCANR